VPSASAAIDDDENARDDGVTIEDSAGVAVEDSAGIAVEDGDDVAVKDSDGIAAEDSDGTIGCDKKEDVKTGGEEDEEKEKSDATFFETGSLDIERVWLIRKVVLRGDVKWLRT
jgi:hypothetical protein